MVWEKLFFGVVFCCVLVKFYCIVVFLFVCVKRKSCFEEWLIDVCVMCVGVIGFWFVGVDFF